MAHDHKHSRESNIALVFFINLAFTIVELIGGILTNSMAVISNAIHDSSDAMALGISWYFERVAIRKRDHIFSFGYKRFSLLAALVNGVLLLAGTIVIVIHAVPRLLEPALVDARGMIAFALIGITVNGLAALRLRKGKSMNENVLTLHLMEDVLGWVAVLIVGVAMMFGEFPILDPLLSLIFAAVILWNGIGRIKKTIMIFLQSIPDDMDIALIEKTLCDFDGVMGVHDTHAWSLDGEHHVLSTHLVLDEKMPIGEIESLKSKIRKSLNKFDIHHATIEVDFKDDICALKT